MERSNVRFPRILMAVSIAVLTIIPSVAWATPWVVHAEGHDWVPAIRRIVKGDAVTWRNPTAARHDVKAYGGNWTYHKVLNPGENVTKRFWKKGRFKYRCTFHSGIIDGVCQGMCGVIRVRLPS
jgi:plastocyanin